MCDKRNDDRKGKSVTGTAIVDLVKQTVISEKAARFWTRTTVRSTGGHGPSKPAKDSIGN
jgi:hypothetical protein